MSSLGTLESNSSSGAIIGMLFWFGTLIILGLFIVAVTYLIVGC